MNLKELAASLGLSPTTVSRALNGYPEVSAATAARVVAAAREHGYVPNSVAKRLATGRAMAIGHVVPQSEHDMINPIFADFIAGAGESYSQAGYNMLISVVPAEEEAASYTALATARSVDGVIVHGPAAQDPRIEWLEDLGLPFIVHGRTAGRQPHSWMDINNRRAFHKATDLLIDLGHRRIALLNGLERMDFAHRRRIGYEDALGAAGITIDPGLMFSADMTEPYGFQTAMQLLKSPEPPSAFLASSLITALGISRAISACGLKLGQDVSVVTHDDALWFLPNQGEVPMFTSTKSSVRAAGKRIAQMLIDQIEGRAEPGVSELWEVEMIQGQSTGPGPFSQNKEHGLEQPHLRAQRFS
ncbi:substrate-binding domain-containing protein [Oceanibium sediminis]|uniref:substrate-binding domain-containing protein n=1 Tax=Oceanibium sediminis TaxID=2026339 RepID=UPI000DD3DD2F|nr:substrate-binding domain-containing protein [Oceanibium sediminis]